MTFDVVAETRATLTEQLDWAGHEVTGAVLQQLATVPYLGDVKAYLAEAGPVITAALSAAIQPTLDAANGSTAANEARTAELEAQMAAFQRDFEQFRRMKTRKTIQ